MSPPPQRDRAKAAEAALAVAEAKRDAYRRTIERTVYALDIAEEPVSVILSYLRTRLEELA